MRTNIGSGVLVGGEVGAADSVVEWVCSLQLLGCNGPAGTGRRAADEATVLDRIPLGRSRRQATDRDRETRRAAKLTGHTSLAN